MNIDGRFPESYYMYVISSLIWEKVENPTHRLVNQNVIQISQWNPQHTYTKLHTSTCLDGAQRMSF